jgi:hypothetical protein
MIGRSRQSIQLEEKGNTMSKQVIVTEWLSETTDTVMKYVVIEKINGETARTSLCTTLEEAEKLRAQWQND